jgi:phosphatidylinositol alpha-1,6-mannosyltransferase
MLQRERHKGHDQLIRAWSLVTREVPDAQLVVVGRGDDVSRLRDLAEQVGVNRDVLFTGPVNDRTLWAIYDRAAMFAMPSRAEGFGIVYLEAMLHRLACVGSIHDAAREIIVDGETGFLVEQGDPVDLAAKIVTLLRDGALRYRLGCNGFARLQAHFSFKRFESQISEYLIRLSA